MNKFDNIKSRIEAIPGANWWIDEILMRGGLDEDGHQVVKGAHAIVGAIYPAPDGGEPLVRMSDPIPIGDLPGGLPMSDFVPTKIMAHQRTIEDQKSRIGQQDQRLQEIGAELAQVTADRDRLKGILDSIAAAMKV